MINVLVIGAGAYATGKNTDGFGTVLPALIEATRQKIVDRITIVAKHSSSLVPVREKINQIQKIANVKLNYEWYLKKGINETAYKNAIKDSDDKTVIIISTPDHLHYDMAKHAMKNHKHVIIVKPLTPTIKDTKSLISLSKRMKLHCIVDFHKRYDLVNLKILDAIRGKKIGDILYVFVEYSQQKNVPLVIFKSWVERTNVFQYLGVHYVDMIHFVTGAKPIRVMAIGQKQFLIKKGINTFDAVQVVIDWMCERKKFLSVLLCNWIDPNKTSAVSYQSIKFIGTKGRIESDQKNRGLQLITDDEGIKDINPYFNQRYTLENHTYFHGYGIESFLQFFKDCNSILQNKISPKEFEKIRPTLSNSLTSVAVTEAVNKSLKTNGRWIYL